MSQLGKRSIAVMGWTLWDGKGRIPSGGAVVTYELAKRLSKYFYCDMVFETSDRSKVGRIENCDAGFRKRFILRPKGMWHLDEDFLRDYDLIHIWGPPPIFTYRAFTRTFLPHCHTLHSAASMKEWLGIASAFLVAGHDMISMGSRCLADALERYWEVPVQVIPYGVDTDIFKPMDKNECRQALGLPEDIFVLGYLGRPSKLDFALAYDTLKMVRDASGKTDILLLVAGGGKISKPVQVKDDFIYLGYIEQPQVPQFLNASDLFFNPVAGVREGFGLNIIEAMACGLPVVSTFWNGYRDTVSADTGFLARTCWKNGDVWLNQKDLASACVQLICHEDLRENMSRNARRRVEQNYKWEYCIDRYRSDFSALIRKDHPDCITCRTCPDKVTVRINRRQQTLALSEALSRAETFGVTFQDLHVGFVSDSRPRGPGWTRFICRDNIANLPKYRFNMRGSLEAFENRLSMHFPQLANALGQR